MRYEVAFGKPHVFYVSGVSSANSKSIDTNSLQVNVTPVLVVESMCQWFDTLQIPRVGYNTGIARYSNLPERIGFLVNGYYNYPSWEIINWNI